MGYRGNLGCLWILLLILLLGGSPLLVGVLRVFLGFLLIVGVGGFLMTLWLRRRAIGQYTSTQSEAHNRFVRALVLLLTRLAEVDGEIDRREVAAIRRFFERNLRYQGERLLWIRDLIKESRGNTESIASICAKITSEFGLQERFIVVQVLTSVAQADGRVSSEEARFIEEVAARLGLAAFMGGFGFGGFGGFERGGAGAGEFAGPSSADRVAGALATLGVGSQASSQEIKNAWRKLSMENHPDRAKHLGEEFAEIAEKRMREINAAHDILKQAGRV